MRPWWWGAPRHPRPAQRGELLRPRDDPGPGPLFVLELGLVTLVGAMFPVSEEHGLSTMFGEFIAVLVVLGTAVGLPRIPVLGETEWALTTVSGLGGPIALAWYLVIVVNVTRGSRR